MPTRNISRFAFAALLGMTFICSHQAHAQPGLPQSAIIADAPLSGAQRASIDEYVQYWIGPLSQTDESSIAQGRKQLIEPLALSNSSHFQSYYSKAVAKAMMNVLGKAKPTSRLNGMIVISRLRDPSALDPAMKAIADDNPAIRYWAAKAIKQIIEHMNTNSQTIPVADQQAVVKSIEKRMGNETAPPVLEQMLLVLAQMDSPAADVALIEALGQRATYHKANPGRAMFAEQAGLQRFFVKLVTRRANNGQAANNKLIIDMTKPALMLMKVAAAELAAGNLSQKLADDHKAFVKISDQVLQWAVRELAPDTPRPAPVRDLLLMDNWTAIQLQVSRWETILSQPPFNHTF